MFNRLQISYIIGSAYTLLLEVVSIFLIDFIFGENFFNKNFLYFGLLAIFMIFYFSICFPAGITNYIYWQLKKTQSIQPVLFLNIIWLIVNIFNINLLLSKLLFNIMEINIPIQTFLSIYFVKLFTFNASFFIWKDVGKKSPQISIGGWLILQLVGLILLILTILGIICYQSPFMHFLIKKYAF